MWKTAFQKKVFQIWLFAHTKEEVLQGDDEIMFVSRSPHVALLLFFTGFLFLLHLLFSRHWTESPILAWTRLSSSRGTWEEQQETRHTRLARVCQENKGRTKQVVDPDRSFIFFFFSRLLKVFVWASQQRPLVWCGQGWIHHLCQVSLILSDSIIWYMAWIIKCKFSSGQFSSR